MIRFDQIELAIDFLRIFEILYVENSTKFREICHTEVVSRRIIDVSKM